MKPFRFPKFFLTLILAGTAMGGWLRAEDPPATPPPAAPVVESPAALPPEAPQADEARVQAQKNLRDAEAAVAKARAEAERLQAEANSAVEEAEKQAEEEEKLAAETKRDRRGRGAGDRMVFADDNHIEAGTTIPHDAIAVMGDLTVDGEVLHDAVAVMGDNTVNGHVHHNVVAIMGDIRLGPKAVVDGDLVCVGGDIHREPGAMVSGRAVVKTPGPNFKSDQFSNWWDHALKIGRPLAIGAHLGWLWVLTGFSIAFYALLGLLFPKRITACGDKLVQEPGLVLLSAVLAVLALPVLFVLLCITIIGIPVALLVLPVSCLVVAMFGKAAIYGLVGRKLTGDRFHPAVSVILGAGLFVLLYLLPVLGLLLSLLVWFLGFGCAVLLMFGRSKPVAPLVPPPAAVSPVAASAVPPISGSVPAAAPAASSPFVVEPPPGAAASAARSVAAMVVTADTMPRAGFWIRVAAALLDFVMLVIPVSILGGMSEGPGFLFLGLAAYHVIMWQLKGTTIGGIICGLKVVRLDDRPLDWGVAIVRALGGFLSFFLAGLGFIWVAFDDEKQSWHDKIAGTTIVKVPKGTALL